MSRSNDMINLPAGYVPAFTAVICANNKQAQEHTGNGFLRFLVQSNVQAFMDCVTTQEQSCIISKILSMIRREGAFVRRVNGVWYDVGDRAAREKIRQTLQQNFSSQNSQCKSTKGRKSQSAMKTSSRNSSRTSSRSSSPIPTPASFPISEICCSTDDDDVSLDFEPLPITQALLKFDLKMAQCSVVSDASSFQDAMNGLYECQFPGDRAL